MLFEDYRKAVVDDYHKMREAYLLSGRLSNPTPGGLKKECLIVYESRYDKKDEKVLRDFFEVTGEVDSYIKAIKRYNIDKFRPLVKHLRGETEEMREESNIELLAWLINFKKRPVSVFKKTNERTNDSSHIREDESVPDSKPSSSDSSSIDSAFGEDNASRPEPSPSGQTPVVILFPSEQARAQGDGIDVPEEIVVGNEPRQVSHTGKAETNTDDTVSYGTPGGRVEQIFPLTQVKRFHFKNIIGRLHPHKAIMAIAVVAFTFVGLILIVNKKEIADLFRKQEWMYWTGYCYQPVSNSREIANARVVRLDQQVMENFKKIKRIDTISERSIRVVYYSKKNNEYEYFTSNGSHPVDPSRTLKPLTRYIWEIYLKPVFQASSAPK